MGVMGFKVRLRGLFALVLLLNLGVWVIAWLNFHGSASLLGLAVIAYSFGLRHALDADHIAAIDNATRRLMLAGRSSRGVGIFFSLGHSTVVMLLSLVIALSATLVQAHFDELVTIGKTLGTGISILFLVTVGLANLRFAVGLWRQHRQYQQHQNQNQNQNQNQHQQQHHQQYQNQNHQQYQHQHHQQNQHQNQNLGEMTLENRRRQPWYGGVFKLVQRSWHMYPLGFLFGLGFESATEVGLLGISAASASSHWPVWQIMIFPLLFSAAMVLVDALDGFLMLGVYGWGSRGVSTKIYYNLGVTLVSVGVALVIAVIQVMGLIDAHFATAAWFHGTVGFMEENFSLIGVLIIGVFGLGWLAAAAAVAVGYRRRRTARPAALLTRAEGVE